MSKDFGYTTSSVVKCTLLRIPLGHVTRALLLAALLPLAACKPSPSTASVAPADSAPATAPAPAPAVLQSLKAGMSYDALQAVLVRDGWLPLEDRDACIASLGNAMANACRNLPQLQSCDTAAATCQVQFAKSGQAQSLQLVVADMQRPGEIQLGNLVSFSATTIPGVTAAATAATCPSTDFNAFLQAFAANADARAALSAPLLQVTRVVEDEESDESPRQVLVTQARYTGFLLGMANGKFQLVDSAGVTQGPIEPVITAQGDNAMQVTLSDNVEGIRYLFRKDASCWRFIGSPEQPTP